MSDYIPKASREISIDSLKVRIPLSEVIIHDKNISAKWLLSNGSTGELIREMKSKGVAHKEHGVKTYYIIFRFKEVEYLAILMNSKLLGERYLEGITSDNVDVVYNALMSQGKVSFPSDVFLDAYCTDVDFKMDVINPIFDRSVKILKVRTKKYSQTNKGSRTDKGNLFCGRRETATIGHPFLKFYKKSEELRTARGGVGNEAVDVKAFFEHYFVRDDGTDTIPDDMVRVETTVKDKRHFKSLGVDRTRFRDLLTLSTELKTNIFLRAYKAHFHPRVITRRESDVTPMDIMLTELIGIAIEGGYSFEMTKDVVLGAIESKTARYRARKKLDHLYAEFIAGTDTEKVSQEHHKFFEEIGWNFMLKTNDQE